MDNKKSMLLNQVGMNKKKKTSKEDFSIVGISETQSSEIVVFINNYSNNLPDCRYPRFRKCTMSEIHPLEHSKRQHSDTNIRI